MFKPPAKTVSPETRAQLVDNMRWIAAADSHAMVVGSQARILYADQQGRTAIALAFNKAIASGEITVGLL